MTKLAVALAGAALALTITGCTGQVPTTDEATSASPAPTSNAEDEGVPTVDRDPQGTLPEITFDADGQPAMTPVDGDPPAVISVKTLTPGDGPVIGTDDILTANYAGFVWSDGSQFDSSYGDEPTSFQLTDVVDGWTYGLPGAKVGDRVLLVVPPDYGYGDLDDEDIPAGSTLVFVVDILDAVRVTTEALGQATPTGATLPEGVTVEGDLGQEPTIVFAEDAPPPTAAQVIVIAKGNGPVITESDTLVYHVAGAFWGESSESSWSAGFEQTDGGGGEETIGQNVGSRLLLTYPEEDEMEAQAVVLDLLAVLPGE